MTDIFFDPPDCGNTTEHYSQPHQMSATPRGAANSQHFHMIGRQRYICYTWRRTMTCRDRAGRVAATYQFTEHEVQTDLEV